MRHLTFLFFLMFVFASLCLVSAPQIVSAHDNGNSHNHPHPLLSSFPISVCTNPCSYLPACPVSCSLYTRQTH